MLLMPWVLSSDAHYAAVRADLESDAQDLEAESWSLAVDPQYVKKHSKEMMKRQDVIYGESDALVVLYCFFRCLWWMRYKGLVKLLSAYCPSQS